VRLSPLGTSATNGPIVPAPDDRWVWSIWWNENWQGKQKYSEKTCPSATLSTTNPTCPELQSNPDRRGGKLTTNLWATALSSQRDVRIDDKLETYLIWLKVSPEHHTKSFTFIGGKDGLLMWTLYTFLAWYLVADKVDLYTKNHVYLWSIISDDNSEFSFNLVSCYINHYYFAKIFTYTPASSVCKLLIMSCYYCDINIKWVLVQQVWAGGASPFIPAWVVLVWKLLMER
jgi:hypothetical protein